MYVDVRSMYRSYGYISNYALYYTFESILNNFVKSSLWSKLIEYLRHVKGISIAGLEIKFSKSLRKLNLFLPRLFNALNDWAKNVNRRAIVVLDEARYLRYSRINFRSLLAYICDNLSNITIILTGSEVGLLHDLLKIDDPRSELYGRYLYEITLKRFTKEQSMDFLIKGFREYGVVPPMDIIEEAVNTFNGIVGWLVFFDRICIDRGISRDAIRETFTKGMRLVLEELEELYNRSPRYRHVLEAIAYGYRKWSEIKRYIVAKELKPIYDSTLHEILLTLQKMGIIEKRV